jgi:C-terminal processing protease CtpA/Prc
MEFIPRMVDARDATDYALAVSELATRIQDSHVCALIKSVAAVTFIGSRTSGANGGVTRTILPGGIVVNFTGQSVRHADGSQLQRVGIVPDIEAHPTLRGIRDGRDDVLERAIEFPTNEK